MDYQINVLNTCIAPRYNEYLLEYLGVCHPRSTHASRTRHAAAASATSTLIILQEDYNSDRCSQINVSLSVRGDAM
ncbi:unnamed protein product [Danaus chrysippus]|nr:unnamed protein product [Danaus chrysippus]